MIARNRRRTVLDGLGLSAAENALHYPAILNRDYGLIGLLAMGTVHKPISAAFLFERVEGLRVRRQQAEDFVIGFDGGDLHWLRGYCNFLSALGELCLAVNGQKGFECSAHLLFEKVETPHTFLLQSRRAFDEHPLNNRETISDAISFLHQLMRLPIKEPARTKAALAHFEAGVAQGKQLWKFILAETDDDLEWIPNPKQTGVMQIQVTQEMVDAWRETLDEAEQILQGKKLIPFWRGNVEGRGVNLRRVFTEPQPTFDVIEWVQGTAATPYLEDGTVTKFAEPGTGMRLTGPFGGPLNFAGFGFWFN